MRKILFWGHLLTGITVGVIVLIKAVTGIIIAYEPQLTEYAERSVRIVTPSYEARRFTLDELAGMAQATFPDKKINSVTVKANPAASVAINFGREGGTYFFNPYTGLVLGGESKLHHQLHEVEDFHRWFWSRPVGRPIGAAATLAFFLLVCSGVYLWWPRKTTRFNNHLSGKARDWNWHNVIGFWLSPFLIVITLSGVVMGFQWANDFVYRITGNEPPPVQARPMGGAKPIIITPSISLASLQETAAIKAPQWVSISLRFPQADKAPVMVNIEEHDPIYPAPRSQLSLNAATGEMVKWDSYREANSGRKLRTWMRYLHSGEAGGVVGQFLALLASVGAIFLVWTGFALSWRRFFRKSA